MSTETGSKPTKTSTFESDELSTFASTSNPKRSHAKESTNSISSVREIFSKEMMDYEQPLGRAELDQNKTRSAHHGATEHYFYKPNGY